MSQLNNLLAYIHRDGGEYILEHGTDKAVKDAIEKVCAWIHDTSKQDNKIMKQCLKDTKLVLEKSGPRAVIETFGQMMREAYFPVKAGEIGEGAQIINGQWYMPKWGCDTLQHIKDNIKPAVEADAKGGSCCPKCTVPEEDCPLLNNGNL